MLVRLRIINRPEGFSAITASSAFPISEIAITHCDHVLCNTPFNSEHDYVVGRYRLNTKDGSDARRDFYGPVGNRRAGGATTKRRPTKRSIRAVQPKQPVHV